MYTECVSARGGTLSRRGRPVSRRTTARSEKISPTRSETELAGLPSYTSYILFFLLELGLQHPVTLNGSDCFIFL